MNRYLTQDEKRRELSNLAAHRLDAGVAPLLRELNQLEGVCTVQSCAGHVRRRWFRRYVESAVIELRLDRERTRRFYERMSELFETAGVEDVKILWRPGYQIARVECLPGTLAIAIEALVAVLDEEATC